jgi:hypothetical protein
MRNKIMKFKEFDLSDRRPVFESKSEDLEDIKWILVEISEESKLVVEVLDGQALLYEISDISSPEDVLVAKSRLDEIGYSMVYIGPRSLLGDENLVCWIVKHESFLGDMNSLPMSTLESDCYFDVDMKAIVATQKALLTKQWEKDPTLYKYQLTSFIKDRRSVKATEEWFREFIGDKAKGILDSILKGEHSISSGGYRFRFSIDRYEISEEESLDASAYIPTNVKVYCHILAGGTVNVYDGRELSIKDAALDKTIGWEIIGEIKDCIIEYLYKDLLIKAKTGFGVWVIF